MPKAKNQTDEDVLEMEQPKVEESPVIDVEKEELRNRLSLLEQALLKSNITVEQPKVVEHDVKAPLEKPKRIVFTIAALDQDDAMHDGAYIPGRAMASEFKFVNELKCNVYGTRYTTGFEYDELEYNSNLSDESFKDYAKDVRIARQWIERYLPGNLSADNVDFWKNRQIKITSLDNIYDTDKSLENLIVYYNILGGGFPSIARSREEAKNSLSGQRLYISVHEEEEKRKFDYRGTLMKAMSSLETIRNSWTKTDALYLMYYLPAVNKYKGYTLNTPIEHILNELMDFIEGVDTKTEKKKRPQMFMDAFKLMEGQSGKDLIRTTAIFNSALYYSFINYNSREKSYKNRSTGFEYGNNSKAAIELLLSDKNIDELSWLKSKVVTDKWVN